MSPDHPDPGRPARNGSRPWWRRILGGGRPGDGGYRHLAFQLHHGLPRGRARRSALIATPAETGVSAHGSMSLAHAIAEELGRPILLADVSQEGELGAVLDPATPEGLTDFAAGAAGPLEELVIETSQPNLSFLPRGTRSGTELTASTELGREILDAAGERWDFVVLSGGALLENGLALSLAPHVGRVLLLVTEGRTQVDHIDQAQSTLRLCGADEIGFVFTERAAPVE